VRFLEDLKLVCGRERITIGAFATDGDGGQDPLRDTTLYLLNIKSFEKDPVSVPEKQFFHPNSDILHALKGARYRLRTNQPMVVGITTDSTELHLKRLVLFLPDNLSAVVFSNDPITKMHDSLPMVLFRFEIRLTISEARECAWVAYFHPWMLINDATSHKHVDPYRYDRMGSSQQANMYLMKITVNYRAYPVRPGIRQFGCKSAGRQEPRLMFDRKLLMHTNISIRGIVYQIKKVKRKRFHSSGFRRRRLRSDSGRQEGAANRINWNCWSCEGLVV
jgi:hypothetical protein